MSTNFVNTFLPTKKKQKAVVKIMKFNKICKFLKQCANYQQNDHSDTPLCTKTRNYPMKIENVNNNCTYK